MADKPQTPNAERRRHPSARGDQSCAEQRENVEALIDCNEKPGGRFRCVLDLARPGAHEATVVDDQVRHRDKPPDRDRAATAPVLANP